MARSCEESSPASGNRGKEVTIGPTKEPSRRRPRIVGQDDLVDQLMGALDEDVARDISERGKDRRRSMNVGPDRHAPEVKAALREGVDEIEEIKKVAKKKLPSYVGSLIFHLILLLILSLIILFPSFPSPPEIIEVNIIFEREELGDATDAMDEEEFQDEAAPKSETDAPEVERLFDQGEPAKIVSSTQENRFGTAKENALRRFGGTPGSELAVRQGLIWLARHQDPGGLWNPYGYQRYCPSMSACDRPGRNVYGNMGIGVSGLALLAFAGNGHSPRGGEFQENATRGVKALIESQDSFGCFGGAVGEKYMYNHVLALLSIIEMYGLTGDAELLAAAQHGVRYMEQAQQVRDGGWDYLARQGRRSDMSVSGWCIMALKSARSAGLEVSEDVWKASASFVDDMTEESGLVKYATAGSHPRTEAQEIAQRGIGMQGVALASRLFLGQSRDAKSVRELAERLRREPPDPKMVDQTSVYGHDMYYWYYGTLGMFQMGGSYWSSWNDHLRDMLVNRQRLDGHAGGSFDPPNEFGGREAGRVYSTAIAVLTLETYYRYLPIYATLREEGAGETSAPGAVGDDDAAAVAAPLVPDDQIDFAKDPLLASYLPVLSGGSLRERIRAISEIGVSESPSAAALLRETYRKRTDSNTRRYVLKALAQLGGVASYPVFLDALASEDRFLVDAALLELPRLTGHQEILDLAGWRAFLAR